MRGAIAVFFTIAGAVSVLALTALVAGAVQWGMPYDPIAVFGTYLLYAGIFAAPLLPIGITAMWLVKLFRLPRPFIEIVIWALAGPVLMHVFWNPSIEGLADASPSAVSVSVLGFVGLCCGALGGISVFVEHQLQRANFPQR